MSDVDVVTSGVKEVRLGLFRICWKHSKYILHRTGITSKEIKLCGSQLGRSALISLEVNPGRYQITVSTHRKVVDKGSIDGKEPSKKHRKLNESLKSPEKVENLVQPKKVWVENALSVSPNKVSELCNYNDSWEGFLHRHNFDSEESCFFLIWIDFGTSEVRQTHINKRLAQMLHSQVHCDVQFHFKGEKSIGAHIVIISASSPVFSDMFQSSLKKSLTNVVFIEDIDVQVFKYLLDYLYTSEAPQLTMSEQMNIMLLHEAAVKYGVEDLKKECVEMLMMQLDMENAIELLIWSKFHVVPELLEAAMKMTVKNCKHLCSQPSWLNLMKNHLELGLEVTKEMADLVEIHE